MTRREVWGGTRLGALAVLIALAGCGTTGALREIETQEVVVTRTERAVSEAQVRELAPPSPPFCPAQGQRPPGCVPHPGDARSGEALALARLCEYVRWGARVDALLQHAAGMAIVDRVAEPVCEGAAAPP